MNWNRVLSFENRYEVSKENGIVRSVPRVKIRSNGRPLTVKGKILAQSINEDGYCVVELHEDDNTNHPKFVHVLVWEAFNGKKPKFNENGEKLEIGHKDGNSKNNSLDNLYICTHPENCNHQLTRQRQSDRMKGNTISKGLISKNRIPIVSLDLNYNLIKEYECISQVKDDGFSIGNVSKCCKNQYSVRGNVSKNRIWMTKSDYEEMLAGLSN